MTPAPTENHQEGSLIAGGKEGASSRGTLAIAEALERAKGHDGLSQADVKEVLATLEAFECWEPLFEALAAMTAKDPKHLEYYAQLARVHGKKLGDYRKSAEICRLLVSNCRIDLKYFRQSVLPYVIFENDYAKEAILLSQTCDVFSARSDQVQALERLCHLYEKKAPNQDLLAQGFEKLIELDPDNLKALKYFKLVYMQENDWPEVVSTLERLIKIVPKHEVYRVGQELAAVYLYQLDNPKMALKIIDENCKNSPLDTSTISYDAYYRLSDWHGCVGVLRTHLPKTEDPNARSILHYKIGSIFELIADNDSAEENYKIAHDLNNGFLEPIEALICIYTEKKDWKGIFLWLGQLSRQVKSVELRAKITEVLDRIKSTDSHAV